MSWNYRIIKHVNHAQIGTKQFDDISYEIHEVYYDEKDHIDKWSEHGIRPCGENIDELKSDIEMMMEAFEKPILIEENEKLIEIPK